MKSIVPYTKDIEFKTKIAEICSISLEHELNITGSEIEGNFIVSGEYKSHEVSVNKEPFNYKLPFTLEVTENIVKDSIEFEITDFTYEVLNNSILKVNIEFCVTADEAEIEEAEIEEMEEIEEEEEPERVDAEKEEIRESVLEEIGELFPDEEEENKEEIVEEERLDTVSENIILNSMEEKESEFATYHIHIVSSSDTIESICALYETDVNTLKSYNNVESVNVGDKLVIPCLDE